MSNSPMRQSWDLARQVRDLRTEIASVKNAFAKRQNKVEGFISAVSMILDIIMLFIPFLTDSLIRHFTIQVYILL